MAASPRERLLYASYPNGAVVGGLQKERVHLLAPLGMLRPRDEPKTTDSSLKTHFAGDVL